MPRNRLNKVAAAIAPEAFNIFDTARILTQRRNGAKPNCYELAVFLNKRIFTHMKPPNDCIWVFALLTGCLFVAYSAFADLKPFPFHANQRGTVACLENPSISYDIYLPPAYSTNGTPLPIIYTFNPNGGGMVTDFQTVCASLNIITVGIISSKNNTPWDLALRDFYSVPRDIRQRVLFDPSAVFAEGVCSGGANSHMFHR